MYIPMYKNRMYETKFLKEYGYLFEDKKIMPYIEIIAHKIGRTKYSKEELIKTYDKVINSKYFLDFFTFAEDEYSQPDLNKLKEPLSIRTQNGKQYLELLLETKRSSKAIPVISIKEARESFVNKRKISFVLKELQKHKDEIAVRIEGALYDDFKDIFNYHLRENDYLFYDIKESKTSPFILDLMDLQTVKSFKKILANSPRKRSLSNGSYKSNIYTDLIDNSIRDKHVKYNFNGYSDYSGLKDDLPRTGGRGLGVALAMFYDYKVNKYYSITNTNVEDGVRGYKNVLKKVQNPKVKSLLRLDKCLSYNYIQKRLIDRNINGTYAIWNLITLIRVISEMKQFM